VILLEAEHMNNEKKRSEWAKGWRVILSAMLGIYLVNVQIYAIGAFMKPLHVEFGWDRGSISLGLTIMTFMSVVGSPIAGLMVDRVGARKVAIPGTVIYCCALALLSQAGPAIQTWWLFSFLLGVGYCMTTSGVWVTGVTLNFTQYRGMAIALSIMGAGIASMTVPYVATILEQKYGWRSAYLVLATIFLLIVLPIALFWFDDASGLRKNSPQAKQRRSVNAAASGFSQIFRSRHFWQLAVACVFSIMGLLGLIVHFIPILTDAGTKGREAAEIAGLIGVGSVLGRLATGYFLDRVHGSVVGCIALIFPIIALIFLLTASGVSADTYRILLGVGALMVGLGLGCETDVIAYLASRYLDLRYYGLTYGMLLAFTSIGVSIGPWLGGVIYDHQHSYYWFELALCASFGIAMLMIGTLGPYPNSSEFSDKS
jgi:predicted MFS family arabinose efflux permease